MSLFPEDPAHLSTCRLKSDLVAHNVALPPARSRKEVYVELHLKHVERKLNAADFSSDEEESHVRDVAGKEEEAETPDPSGLTDDDLKAALLKHGVKAGPIVASTRGLYEKKLSKLLQFDGHSRLNREEKDILYSDDEEEEEEEVENGEEQDEESGTEGAQGETLEPSDEAQQGSGQKSGFVYPQCFLLSSRLHARASRHREPSPKRNSGNAIESLERSLPRCSQIPGGISRASSVDQHSGLGSGVPSGSQSVTPNDSSSISPQAFSITQMVEEMESWRSHSTGTDAERDLNGSNVQGHWSRSSGDMPVVDRYSMKNQSLYYTPKTSTYETEMKLSQEPVKDTFKDMFPNTDAIPTGIYVTRRRPIKGAAGRPVRYAYPDTPTSPTTTERREVERRLVPVQIQILVFLIVACLLYLIYTCVEDNSFSPFGALVDSPNQGSHSEEGLLLQAETQHAPALSGQD